jgi:hypothetical protein
MHGPIKVKSPNNTRKWQMGFNSTFKGLTREDILYKCISGGQSGNETDHFVSTSGFFVPLLSIIPGHAVAQLVEAVRYRPEGRGFNCVIGIFHWHIPSGRTMALWLIQPLTEISTRNISSGVNVAGA